MNLEFKKIKDKIYSKSITLLPKINHKELISFEDKFQVELPEDYKYFLSEMGSGFEKSYRFLTPKNWEESFWVNSHLINPFKYTCKIKLEHQLKSNWLELIKDPINDMNWKNDKWDPMFGTIAIGEIGCGLYYRMILNGELKGRIFVWGDHALNPPKFIDQVGYLNWINFQIDIYP